MGVSALQEQKSEGDAPPPRQGEWFFDDAEALVGVKESVGLGEDPDMLGDGAKPNAEEDERAGAGLPRVSYLGGTRAKAHTKP